MDPYAASYGVENAMYAVTQLAQTTMRSELGKISLDSVFAERCIGHARTCVHFRLMHDAVLHAAGCLMCRDASVCSRHLMLMLHRDTLNQNIVTSIQ
jgi:hypothetical protein